MIAVYNPSKDILFSPMADGPIQYTGSISSSSEGGGGQAAEIHVLSKYGRDFSIVAVPYAFKLFMQELTSMNVQMRLITADNIEQLTKQGDRRINDKQFNLNSITPTKEEDIFERLKRENEEFDEQKNKNITNVKVNENAFIVEPELLSKEEKIQILNMPPIKIEQFINSHKVTDLTPAQKNILKQIIERSKFYSRLESEVGDDELYKTILKDEIDRMFEPTNSELAMLAEYNKLNQNRTQALSQGQSQPQSQAQNQSFVVNKVGSNKNEAN
jgi:hypothetical protein